MPPPLSPLNGGTQGGEYRDGSLIRPVVLSQAGSEVGVGAADAPPPAWPASPAEAPPAPSFAAPAPPAAPTPEPAAPAAAPAPAAPAPACSPPWPAATLPLLTLDELVWWGFPGRKAMASTIAATAMAKGR